MQRSTPTTHPTAPRRGNAMVLVAGLLVLLVIVVTAFLTSAQSTRELASAQKQRVTRDVSVDSIAEDIAGEIAMSLFARPVFKGNTPADQDPSVPANIARWRDGNVARLDPPFDAVRYSVDWDVDGIPGADVAWNGVPYHIVPWTNWPDDLREAGYPVAEEELWIRGPGAPLSDPNPALSEAESNPLGDPGFGDTRWLSDSEPLSWDLVGGLGIDGLPNTYRMWRHMSYIARPENGWRLVRDISNVGGNIQENLRYPVEQWMTTYVPNHVTWNTSPGTGGFGNAVWQFNGTNPDLGADYVRWQDWFTQYPFVYADPNRIPHNLYSLSDPDANGILDPPTDSFRPGTPRWDLNRVLDDADGDGFTDSFWWLAPQTDESGIRHVVSYRIVDNASMLNANVATRFESGIDNAPPAGSLPTNPYVPYATRGQTPSDLALIGRGATTLNFDPSLNLGNGFNVGFLDSIRRTDTVGSALLYGGNFPQELFGANDSVGWNGAGGVSEIWPRFANALGLPGAGANSFRNGDDRRLYFNLAGSQPLSPREGLTPFGLEDEAELRYWSGNNYPWTFTRFENALEVDPDIDTPAAGILRAARRFRESAEFINNAENFRLNSFEHFLDVRHRLTLFSGSRNDLKPPWLRWRAALPRDLYRNGATPTGQDLIIAEARFLAQAARKLDLRSHNPQRALNGNAVDEDFIPRQGERYFHERLPEEILQALFELDTPTGTDLESYFGEGDFTSDEFEDSRILAASLGANILSRRDFDRDRMNFDWATPADVQNIAPLYDELLTNGQRGAVSLPAYDSPTVLTDHQQRVLGLEVQPFLTEAFMCFVHGTREFPAIDTLLFEDFYVPGGGGLSTGDFRLVDDSTGATTVMAFQLANPFHQSIPWNELRKYGFRIKGRLTTFDRIYAAARANDPSLPDEWDMLPSSRLNPVTATVVIVEDSFTPSASEPAISNFADQWLDFLDLDLNTTPGSLDSVVLEVRWSDIAGFSGAPSEFYCTTPGAGGPGGTPGTNCVSPGESIIDLVRIVNNDLPTLLDTRPAGVPAQEYVVVDRMGYEGGLPSRSGADRDDPFLTELARFDSPPAREAPTFVPAGTGGNSEVPGIRVPGDVSTLLRPISVRRGWDIDLDGRDNALNTDSLGVQPDESAPRYIFAEYETYGPEDYAFFSDGDLNYRRVPSLEGDRPAGDVTNYDGIAVGVDSNPDGNLDNETPPVTVDEERAGAWFVGIQEHPYGALNTRVPADDPTTPQDDTLFTAKRPTAFDGSQHFIQAAAREVFADAVDDADMRMHFKGDIKEDVQSLQMLQKDDDYEQVGEVFLTFRHGHLLRFTGGPAVGLYDGTERTFSELIRNDRGVTAGRLDAGRVIGGAPAAGGVIDPTNRLYSVPALAAGSRLLGLFVCDGAGFNWDPSVTGAPSYDQIAFSNAAGFTGRATPGMINVNTASPEVMGALPHWTSLVHEFEERLSSAVGLPHAIVAYRERYDNFNDIVGASWGIPGGPDYRNRVTGQRGERGIVDIGEVITIDRNGVEQFPRPGLINGALFSGLSDDAAIRDRMPAVALTRSSWRASYAARRPLSDGFDWQSSRLSTDLMNPDPAFFADPGNTADLDLLRREGDLVSGDIEEVRMLFNGASNLITTTSDVFTVYFRVRSFRPRADGVLDATNRDSVLADRRYIMLVDRSGVNTPNDRPRILYLQEVPD